MLKAAQLVVIRSTYNNGLRCPCKEEDCVKDYANERNQKREGD